MPRRTVYARHSVGGDARRDTKTSASEPVHPTFLRQRKDKMLHKHLRCRRIRISSQGRDLFCPSYLCAGKVPILVWLQVVGRHLVANDSLTIHVFANHDSNRYSKALQSDPKLNLLNCRLQEDSAKHQRPWTALATMAPTYSSQESLSPTKRNHGLCSCPCLCPRLEPVAEVPLAYC